MQHCWVFHAQQFPRVYQERSTTPPPQRTSSQPVERFPMKVVLLAKWGVQLNIRAVFLMFVTLSVYWSGKVVYCSGNVINGLGNVILLRKRCIRVRTCYTYSGQTSARVI
jgi:hypothetical protein